MVEFRKKKAEDCKKVCELQSDGKIARSFRDFERGLRSNVKERAMSEKLFAGCHAYARALKRACIVQSS